MTTARPVQGERLVGGGACHPACPGRGSTGATSPAHRRRRRAARKLIDDYKARFANPRTAAERGYVDDVLVPHESRPKAITALETLQAKREPGPKRKHGNIPL
jgi:propionyl-CoA carboxylase beta chain